MEKDTLSQLLKKYVDGKCTPDELKLIDEWFSSHEQNPDDDRLIDLYEREDLESKMFERIKANVVLSHKLHAVRESSSSAKMWYKVAAALVIVMLTGLGLYIYSQQASFSEDELNVSSASNKKVTNNTASVMHHALSDGTVIMLQPNGTLEFPLVFPADKREIVLTGEAFFDVTKDKDRPFIINTGDLTVKVLGTSFNVRAYQGAKEISVAVKTGKVSVYAKGDEVDSQKNATKKEIILTPNQEVVYNTVDENFSRKIVDDPQIILDNPTLFAMEYDGTPVVMIFQVMEENYGIDIVYNEESLALCSLTTSMSEEGLFERIEIICEAIGARYEMVDGKIIVSGNGCL